MDEFLYALVPDTDTNTVLFWFCSFRRKIGKSKELIGLSEVSCEHAPSHNGYSLCTSAQDFYGLCVMGVFRKSPVKSSEN
jgi:hypothetical protein